MVNEAALPPSPPEAGGHVAKLDQGFPPAARLHDNRDYSRVFHRQQKAAAKQVVLLLRPRYPKEAQRGRLGVMIGTKVAPLSVRRHQLKRWVREWYRLGQQERLRGFDCVVMFRADPPAEGHAALCADLSSLAAKALAAKPQPEARRGGGRR